MKLLTSTAAILSSLVASACCLLPVVLASVAGVVGVASFLEGLRPLFLGLAFLFLGCGFYVAYFRNLSQCSEDEICATPKGRKRQRIILWSVTILVVIISTFPYWIQWF